MSITRVGPRALDDDNLIASCKPARDAIAQWLKVDDGPNSPATWRYHQRTERVPNPTPRAKRKHRTWIEVSVAPGEHTAAAPMRAPPRHVRERISPDVQCGTDRVKALLDRALLVRASGASLHIALITNHGYAPYIRVCTHYVQQGHEYRTQGIRIELSEIENLIGVILELARAGAGGAGGVPGG